MNVILIGAGRGNRLRPLTDQEPKCFTVIAGKRILDWTLDAFRQNGLGDFIFIGGYLIDAVFAHYPNLDRVENTRWADNNILFSLMHAREHMNDGFYATYTDTLYRPKAIAALKESPHDITVVMDTEWRRRYLFRSQHPEADAEKMVTSGGMVNRISRSISSEDATGEYTGVMRMTPKGASQFLEFFDHLYGKHGHEGIFAEDKPFRLAYVIHQLDSMIQSGIKIHCVAIPGDYYEIDTLEDFQLASTDWAGLIS